MKFTEILNWSGWRRLLQEKYWEGNGFRNGQIQRPKKVFSEKGIQREARKRKITGVTEEDSDRNLIKKKIKVKDFITVKTKGPRKYFQKKKEQREARERKNTYKAP